VVQRRNAGRERSTRPKQTARQKFAGLEFVAAPPRHHSAKCDGCGEAGQPLSAQGTLSIAAGGRRAGCTAGCVRRGIPDISGISVLAVFFLCGCGGLLAEMVS